jgi:4-hydroxy-tetrahydrodipicolinate synthase
MRLLPAAVTPFDARGELDFVSLAKLLAHFEATGCDGVVVAGTNGEGPSLSAPEKRDLAAAAVKLAGRLQVVLGIATPSLTEAQWLARQAGKVGTHGLLLMAPAYFREAPEDALAEWLEAVCDVCEVPVLIYNFPQRTGFALSADCMSRLARHGAVEGLKDSSGDEANLAAYASAMPGKRLYTGDETLLLKAVQHGWAGTISGAANVLSRQLSGILTDTDPASQRTKFALLLPGIQALRSVPQPAANKAMLHRMGVVGHAGVRLPLTAMGEEEADALGHKLGVT